MSDTPRTDAAAFSVTTGEPDIDGVVMADFARELERENAALREWVKEEGKRNDVCTYGILEEVCEDCKCSKRKEAQP